MRSDLGLLHKVYGGLLMLYPKTFREGYGEELQSVFDLSIDDAGTNGGFEMTKVLFRELTSLPMAAFLEHLRQRRISKMTGNFASRYDIAPGSRREVWAALAPFLFGMVNAFVAYLDKYITFPLWIYIAFAILILASMFGVLLVGGVLSGSAQSLPRWFLPYMGLPLPIISILLYNAVIDPKWPGFNVPWLVGSILMEGLLWGWMILMVIVLVSLSVWIPKFHPFYRRLRNDWTLLSFLLYGATPLALFITFNEYKNVEPFYFLSLLVLALGGWFYLRNDAPWKRFWFLFIGSALSLVIAAVGKGIMYDESWPLGLDLGWKNEMVYTMVTWAWLALILFLPYMLNWLPRPGSTLQVDETVTV